MSGYEEEREPFGEEDLEPLERNEALPPSMIEPKYLKVARHHKIFYTEADIPDALKDMNAAEWKNQKFLRESFKVPKSGRQRKDQQTHYAFPICLILFGPASSDLYHRMIVVNWWLNLSKEEQKEAWERLRKQFVTPFDSDDLRKRKVEESRSYEKLHGTAKRSKHSDMPRSNAQLRDQAVRYPEALACHHLKVAMDRSQVTAENESLIDGRYELCMMTYSTVHTPEKSGRPRLNKRSIPKVSLRSRDRDALVAQFGQVVAALKNNGSVQSIDDLTPDLIVESLEESQNCKLSYVSDAKNWTPNLYLDEQRSRRKSLQEKRVLPSASDGSGTTTIFEDDESGSDDDGCDLH